MNIHKDPLKSDARAICAALADRSSSPIVRVARQLSPAKQRFFNAAYASMRLIDDLVDDRNLGDEAAVGNHLGDWQQALEHAAMGRPATSSDHQNDDPKDRLTQASIDELSQLLPQSSISINPWRQLIASMRIDLNRQALANWDEFDRYALGASCAPTEIFLFVLLAREENGRLTCNADCAAWARTLGLYCYLGHISRDLVKDARQGAHLLTVPLEAMAPFKTRGAFAAALLAKDPGCNRVRRAIAARAPALEQSCREALRDIESECQCSRTVGCIRSLVDHYGAFFEPPAFA